MKPLDGNFASNAMRHGVAGINVDGTRIQGPKGAGVWGTSNKTINRDRKFNASPEMDEYRSERHSGGRWPANVVLGHCSGCRCLGSKKVKGGGHWTNKCEVGKRGIYGRFRAMDIDRGNILEGDDGKETVEDFECQEGCPVRAMDRQSGVTVSPYPHIQKSKVVGIYGAEKHHDRLSTHYGDTGFASRYFKRVGV